MYEQWTINKIITIFKYGFRVIPCEKSKKTQLIFFWIFDLKSPKYKLFLGTIFLLWVLTILLNFVENLKVG